MSYTRNSRVQTNFELTKLDKYNDSYQNKGSCSESRSSDQMPFDAAAADVQLSLWIYTTKNERTSSSGPFRSHSDFSISKERY
jgi:hypothetical protein